MRRSVVLPQPEAPTIETKVPDLTSSETSRSASIRRPRRLKNIEMLRASSLDAPSPTSAIATPRLLQLELAPGGQPALELLEQHHRQDAGAGEQEDAHPHRIDLEALRRAEDHVAQAGARADEL